MKHLTYCMLIVAGSLLLHSCMGGQKKINWNIVLDKESKDPYGTYLAYESLPGYFPQAKCIVLSRGFRYSSIGQNMLANSSDSAALLVMLGLDYYISEDEWTNLKTFVSEGNEIFILSSRLDNKIATQLHCLERGGSEEAPLTQYYDGTINREALRLATDTARGYGFTGRSLQGHFQLTADTPAITTFTDSTLAEAVSELHTEADTSIMVTDAPAVIGVARNQQPNFVRYRFGSGHITLHAAPLTFSNYFLLQPRNREYLNGVWHSFPANISKVYWNEYYKRTTEKSSLGILWRYTATRWALILAIVTLLIYVLLGLKRKQRIIPIIKPVENASVAFVETVGKLYYNKGNHANLAHKMIQHFLEWVRAQYFLDTNQLNEVFAQQLAAKSGQPEAKVQEIIRRIHDIRLDAVPVTGTYLYELHHLIQSFYNNASS